MKKLLATMLVGVVGITAIAQTVVYDYKATFKRIDPIYKLRTLDPKVITGTDVYPKRAYVTESYGVKSDTIFGYVVLPLCESCQDGSMVSSNDYTMVEDNTHMPFAYLARKGDTMTKVKKPGDLIFAPYVAKVAVGAKAAIFKSTVYDVPETRSSIPQVDLPKTMDAWMTLDFAIPNTPYYMDKGAFVDIDKDGDVDKEQYLSIDPGHVIAKAASSNLEDLLIYGFLGLDNTIGNYDLALFKINKCEDPEEFDAFKNVNRAGEGYVVNKGFGQATVITKTTPGSISVCGGESASSSSCTIVSSISGAVVGEFGYRGGCGVTPMWDICDVAVEIRSAPIVGTWTLKYNKTMTDKGDVSLQEKAIQSKLGWDKATKLEEAVVE